MYQLNFDDRELQAFAQLLDAAVRAGGLNAVGPAFMWQQKLIGAVEMSKVQPADNIEIN